jgi:hypothetical protein
MMPMILFRDFSFLAGSLLYLLVPKVMNEREHAEKIVGI